MTALTEMSSSRLWGIFLFTGKLRILVEVALENVRCKVTTQNGTSDLFITRKELRQGDVLSCMLCNIAQKKAVRVAELDIRGTVLHKSVQILAYADDILIIARYERAMKEAFIQLETVAKQMGLMVNYQGIWNYPIVQPGRTILL
jgi:hypothetical protein